MNMLLPATANKLISFVFLLMAIVKINLSEQMNSICFCFIFRYEYDEMQPNRPDSSGFIWAQNV